VPQIYRMERNSVRRIGDNANLIRKFPAMEGRIFAVDFSPDGKTFWAANEYIGSDGATDIWRTHITSFAAKCAEIDEEERPQSFEDKKCSEDRGPNTGPI